MTVTMSPSDGPRLDAKTEVGVHIIKLPPRAAVAAIAGPACSEKDIMAAAAKLAGPAHPTDIVVFDHHPWHKVHGDLHAHPQVHINYPETILQISFGEKQRAVWWSTEPFTITRIKPSSHPHGAPPAPGPAAAGPPDNPFDGPPEPYVARPEPGAWGTVFAVRARPIVLTSVGYVYKITFDMGEEIDPDMSCNV